MIDVGDKGFAEFFCNQKRNGTLTDCCDSPAVRFMSVDNEFFKNHVLLSVL